MNFFVSNFKWLEQQGNQLMKRINSVLTGSKLWLLIKDIMAAINSGKKPVQAVYRNNDVHTSYLISLAAASSLR